MGINTLPLVDTCIHYVRNVDVPREEGEQSYHGARVACIERCHMEKMRDYIQGLREWRFC